MQWFYALGLPCVAGAVAWGLVALPSKSTGLGVRLDVGLAWASALFMLMLGVPLDVAAALRAGAGAEGGGEAGQLAALWRWSYWYGFAAQVLVLPLHMEATRRGEFTAAGRLGAALLYHVRYYALLAAVAAAGVLLLLLSGRLQPANVLGLFVAASYAYGLVASLFLLGYGLVAVPRSLWRRADPGGEARRLQHAAGAQAARAAAARVALSAAVLTARRVGSLFSRHDPLRRQVDAVLALADSVGPAFTPSPGAEVPPDAELDYFDAPDLARLRRMLKTALRDDERERAIYRETVEAYLAAEAASSRCSAGPPADAGLRGRLRWAWGCHGRAAALRAAAVAAGVLSLAIAVAEATIPESLPNASLVSWAVRAAAARSALGGQVLTLAFLSYLVGCAYYSVYRLGRLSFYRMARNHTDSYSLCFSALLVCRFSAPLAFNFLTALALPPSRFHDAPDVTDTVFWREFGALMADQPLILIGWHFQALTPVLLIPWMLILCCGSAGRVLRSFKRGLEFEDEFGKDGHAAAGRRLLRQEVENVRSGRPAGLAIEETDSAPEGPAGSGVSGRGSCDALPGSGRGDGGQPEQAERQGRRRPWWRRLLGGPGGGSSDGDSSGEQWEPPSSRGRAWEVQAARGRLVGTLHTRHGGQVDSPLMQPLLEGSEGRGGPPVRGGGGRHGSLDVESLEGAAP